ncbi:MAG: hypothetical protein WCA85_34565 [Paraburkholderia sp.]|uniref:hypothetical protein n=1 Tax=Paraburkholderia sp. TaxID=1926495 RepID=UPI003C477F30
MKTDMQQYLKMAGSEADLASGGVPTAEAAVPVAVVMDCKPVCLIRPISLNATVSPNLPANG